MQQRGLRGMWRSRHDVLHYGRGVRKRWLLRRNEMRRQRQPVFNGTGLRQRDMPSRVREFRTDLLRWQVPERRLLRDRRVLRSRCAMPDRGDCLCAREWLCGVRRWGAALLRGKRLQRHDQGHLPDRCVQCLRRLRSAVLRRRCVSRRQNVPPERNVSLT